MPQATALFDAQSAPFSSVRAPSLLALATGTAIRSRKRCLEGRAFCGRIGRSLFVVRATRPVHSTPMDGWMDGWLPAAVQDARVAEVNKLERLIGRMRAVLSTEEDCKLLRHV